MLKNHFMLSIGNIIDKSLCLYLWGLRGPLCWIVFRPVVLVVRSSLLGGTTKATICQIACHIGIICEVIHCYTFFLLCDRIAEMIVAWHDYPPLSNSTCNSCSCSLFYCYLFHGKFFLSATSWCSAKIK